MLVHGIEVQCTLSTSAVRGQQPQNKQRMSGMDEPDIDHSSNVAELAKAWDWQQLQGLSFHITSTITIGQSH